MIKVIPCFGDAVNLMDESQRQFFAQVSKLPEKFGTSIEQVNKKIEEYEMKTYECQLDNQTITCVSFEDYEILKKYFESLPVTPIIDPNTNYDELYLQAEKQMNDFINDTNLVVSWGNAETIEQIFAITDKLKKTLIFKYVTLAEGIESNLEIHEKIHDSYRELYDKYVDEEEEPRVSWKSASDAIAKVRSLKKDFEDAAKDVLLNAIL